MRCMVTNVPGTQGLKRYMYVATAPVILLWYEYLVRVSGGFDDSALIDSSFADLAEQF